MSKGFKLLFHWAQLFKLFCDHDARPGPAGPGRGRRAPAGPGVTSLSHEISRPLHWQPCSLPGHTGSPGGTRRLRLPGISKFKCPLRNDQNFCVIEIGICVICVMNF